MSRLVGASAPGKLVLLGEYAVLFGAPAVVTAVDRRAEARFTDDPAERPRAPEAAGAVDRVEAAWGALDRGLSVDVAALRTGDMKLGLGSSAAAAVAAASAALLSRGARLEPRALFDLADEAHRSIQPGGSGVDVAAAAYGGTLRFARRGGVHVERLALPKGLSLRVVFTGKEASTGAMIAALRRFEASNRRGFEAARDALGRAAERAAARATESATAFVEEAGAYGRALEEFGARAGLPIVEEASLRVSALAAAHGGAAKPSGAGGGDVAVAFFPDEARAASFEREARGAGDHVLSLRVDAEGPGPLTG